MFKIASRQQQSIPRYHGGDADNKTTQNINYNKLKNNTNIAGTKVPNVPAVTKTIALPFPV
jgi:hypothetical protein